MTTDISKTPAIASPGSIIADPHKRVSRAVGYALTVGLPSHWNASAVVWEANLRPDERADLARSVLMAMSPDDIAELAADLLEGAGFPLPPFMDSPSGEAHLWSEVASRDEVQAYCLASFRALSAKDQVEFVSYVSKDGRIAA